MQLYIFIFHPETSINASRLRNSLRTWKWSSVGTTRWVEKKTRLKEEITIDAAEDADFDNAGHGEGDMEDVDEDLFGDGLMDVGQLSFYVTFTIRWIFGVSSWIGLAVLKIPLSIIRGHKTRNASL